MNEVLCLFLVVSSDMPACLLSSSALAARNFSSTCDHWGLALSPRHRNLSHHCECIPLADTLELIYWWHKRVRTQLIHLQVPAERDTCRIVCGQYSVKSLQVGEEPESCMLKGLAVLAPCEDCKYQYGLQSGHSWIYTQYPTTSPYCELGTDLDYTLPQIADFWGIGSALFNLTRSWKDVGNSLGLWTLNSGCRS
jgi:hypothetical protein